MNGIVVSEKTHMCTLTSWKLVKGFLHCIHSFHQEATGHRVGRDIKCEEIRRRHRRADHVLLACDELYRSVPQLRTLCNVPSCPICVERAEVVDRYLVRQLAHIATEPSTAVDELYKRIDISTASTAPNYARAAELRYGNLFSRNKWAYHAANR